MHSFAVFLLLPVACGDPAPLSQPSGTPPPGLGTGAIAGRVCQPDGDGWLPDAQVYTHLLQDGVPVDTLETWTDRAGRFVLEGLPVDASYDVMLQWGSTRLVDQEVYGVVLVEGEVVHLPEPDCGEDPADVQLGVVEGSYDSVELVLGDLGYTNLLLVDGLDPDALVGFLTDATRLSTLDMVLVDGGHLEAGVVYATTEEEQAAVDAVLEGLRAYVEGGGTLLASDWSYDLVERAWPDRLAFFGDDGSPDSAQLGQPARVLATVVDDDLGLALGTNTLQIDFDLPEWPAITEVGSAVDVLLTGDVEIETDAGVQTLYASPLLVEVEVGRGHVLFSTFPFAANRDGAGAQVLDHLVRAR